MGVSSYFLFFLYWWLRPAVIDGDSSPEEVHLFAQNMPDYLLRMYNNDTTDLNISSTNNVYPTTDMLTNSPNVNTSTFIDDTVDFYNHSTDLNFTSTTQLNNPTTDMLTISLNVNTSTSIDDTVADIVTISPILNVSTTIDNNSFEAYAVQCKPGSHICKGYAGTVLCPCMKKP